MPRLTRAAPMLCFGALLVAAPAAAQTVTATSGTQYNVAGTINELATGSSMVGMTVTATFANGTSQTGTWGYLGQTFGVADYGVVFADLLRVSHLDTDTYPLTPWYFRQLGTPRVTRLVFDGAPGLTAFDRALGFLGLAAGTPGSGAGGDYTDLNLFWNGSSAVYSNVVALAPNAPVGDLYRTLTVNFGQQLPSNVLGVRELYFSMDTDRIVTDVSANVVPEPATFALSAAGLLALGAAARRRRAT